IRENGGQYTHAAIWVIQAMALQGRGGDAHTLFDLVNPIRHAETAEAAARYRVEPYVVAADVYGRPPHVGRGGWTWYTGSASWLYRIVVESILGIELHGDRLRIAPCIPADWRKFEVTLRRNGTTWRICVNNVNCLER